MKKTFTLLICFLTIFLVSCGEKIEYKEAPRYNQAKITVGEERGSISVFILAKNNETTIDYIVSSETLTLKTKEDLLKEEKVIHKGQEKGLVNKLISNLEDDKTYLVYTVLTLNNLESEILVFDAKTMTETEFLIKGKGTEEEPFLIDSVWQLAAITTGEYGYIDSAHYELTKDLDLLAEGYDNWTPIGKQNGANKKFSGVFNGNGHTISNLKIHSSSGTEKWGLFQELAIDGVIHNLKLKNVDIQVDGFRIGSLVGYAKGTMFNIHVENGNIHQKSGEGQVGGIVGAFYDAGSIQKSSFIGTVKGAGRRIGGIVGAATTSPGNDIVYLGDLYFEGKVEGFESTARQVGGILGAGTGVKVSVAVVNAEVLGVRQVGGVVGYIESNNTITGSVDHAIYVGTNVSADGSDNNKTIGAGFILGDASVTKGEYVVEKGYHLDGAIVSNNPSSRSYQGETIQSVVLKDSQFYKDHLPFFNIDKIWDITGQYPVLKGGK